MSSQILRENICQYLPVNSDLCHSNLFKNNSGEEISYKCSWKWHTLWCYFRLLWLNYESKEKWQTLQRLWVAFKQSSFLGDGDKHIFSTRRDNCHSPCPITQSHQLKIKFYKCTDCLTFVPQSPGSYWVNIVSMYIWDLPFLHSIVVYSV